MEVLRGLRHFPVKTALRAVSGLFLCLLTGIPGISALESEGIGQWGGLNNSVDPVIISPNQAQDCLNVDVSRNAASIKQREGYVLTQQLTIATSPVLNLAYFKNSAGDVIKISAHDILVQKSVNGAPFETFITSAAKGIMWDFESNGGYIYAVNSNRDTPWKYDGTTRSNIAAIPAGTQIEFSPERAIVADVAGYPNRIYFSEANDYTDWTVGVEETSPWYDEIGVGGEDVTAIKYALGRLFVFKRNSISACYVDNQFTSYCATINNGLGVKKTDFHSVIQYLNYLYFKGNDDYYYKTDGAIFEKISTPVTTFLNSIVKGEERSNTQTTQDHWNAGTISYNGPGKGLNTTITVGSVQGSTWTHVDTSSTNFTAGTLSNLSSTQTAGSLELLGYPYQTADNFNDEVASWTITSNTGLVVIEGGTNTYTAIGNNAGCGNEDSLGGVDRLCIYGLTLTSKEVKLHISTQSYAYGKWGLTLRTIDRSAGTLGTIFKYYFISSTSDTATTDGYYFEFDTYNMRERLMRVSAGSDTQVSSVTMPVFLHRYNSCVVEIVRNSTNTFIISGSTAPNFAGNYCNFVNFTGDDSVHTNIRSNYQMFDVLLYDIPAGSLYGMSIDSLTIGGYVSSGTFTSAIFDTTFSTAIGGPFSFSETVPVASTLAYSVRESTWNSTGGMGAWTLVSTTASGAFRIPHTKQYWQYTSTFTTDYSSQTPSIESVTLNSISTGTFISQCIQPDTDISAWGNFTGVMTSTWSGSGTYYSRSAATCAGLLTESWTAQTNNVVVSVATNTAYQFRWDSNIYTSTDTAQLDAVTINWKRGDNPAYSYGVYHDDALYWTITYSSGQINNRTLKYDLNFNEWFPFDIHMNSPIDIDNTLYFGDSQYGKVYQYGNVDSDNNVAINSYWKSKDFTGNSPFIEKTYSTLSLIGKNQTTGTLELEYKTNGSTVTTTTYDYTVYLSSGTGNLLRYNHRMPIGVYGTSFNLKFSNNAADEPWEMYNAIWTYEPKNWRVLP